MRSWPVFLLVAAFASAAPPGAVIVRDSWGVPYIAAATDAGAVRGLMYAQAEDNFWQIEETYIRALGRSAEVYGPSSLGNDLWVRLFEPVRRARAEYDAAAPAVRALYDAFAQGLNHYLATHPQAQPRLIARFEPWHILATHYGPPSPSSLGISEAEIGAAFPALGPAAMPAMEPRGEEDGSNMFAVGPAKSAAGRAMLFINPHTGFFGGGQCYEAHLLSAEGLEVSGFAILGTPYIRSGFNRRLGWSHTDNFADVADVWEERFDLPGRPLAYRHGGGYRDAEEWTETIAVRGDAGMETRTFRLRKTHHGPVVGVRDGRALTARVASLERSGLMEQRWAMARARSLEEFRAAMARCVLTGSNTMYADVEGNIWYMHGNAIPRRAGEYDWSRTLDGADPGTEWLGWHDPDEVPQILNPPSGWMQNCNSTVFETTSDGNPERGRYPAYMVTEEDTLRARRARQVLGGTAVFTFEEFARAVLDTRISLADDLLPPLLEAPAPPAVADMMAELAAWDRTASVDAVGMTLFTRLSTTQTDPAAQFARLESARAALERDFGTWRVPWGEVNRLQRIHTSGTLEDFSDARPSIPAPGARGYLGCLRVFVTRTPPGQKRGYGISGNCYVAVVEFGPVPRAFTQMVFGQSADPQSPHWFDQAEFYSRGKFKPARLIRREFRRHLERAYWP